MFNLYEEDIYTSNTLSGWIIEFFEKVPACGEEMQFKNMDIKILEADDRKIKWVQIHKHCKEEDEEGEED